MSKLGRYSADRKKIENLTADKTVEVSDCGTIFTLSLATGLTASLPNASDAGKGWWCKFIVATAPTHPYMINCTAGDGDNLHGIVTYASGSDVAAGSAADLSDGTAGTAVDQVRIVGGVSDIGDQVELVTDGSNWYTLVHSYNNEAVTFD